MDISCYASEVNDYTTLVSGKVKVDFERGKQSFVLEPGMQVAYDKKSGIATERKVDVAEFVAWKNGKYVFKQKRLEVFCPPCPGGMILKCSIRTRM